jgi:hypothetical protein
MSAAAAMDVAYLDLPYVAHVPRKEFLLRMCTACWEDSCWNCQDLRCTCGCRDDPPARALPSICRCRLCGQLAGALGHEVTCGQRAAERITRLADSIGTRREALAA